MLFAQEVRCKVCRMVELSDGAVVGLRVHESLIGDI